MEDFDRYQEQVIADIESTIGKRECQPIIFAGSGLSMRYFSAPSWDELLEEMAGKCPKLDHNYGYYRQTRDEREMGQLLADQYARWAWDKNETKFQDKDILDHRLNQDVFIKSEVSDFSKKSCLFLLMI